MREIWRYSVEQWGVARADAYVRRLVTQIDALAAKGHRTPSVDYLHPGLRQMKVASHLIFFLIGESGIDVVRLLHERMDAATRLAEDIPPYS